MSEKFKALIVNQEGEKFSRNNIRKIRPGYGLSPIYFDKILKKKSPQNISEGEPLTKKIVKIIWIIQNKFVYYRI